MEMIDVSKNCVTTECGHKFHTSCLMRNVSFNGFECPYCRTVMAEDDDEDSNDEEYDEDNAEDEDAEDEDDDIEEPPLLRWIIDEDTDEIDENYPLSNEDPIPSFDLILKTLIEKNVSYEDLVKCTLFGHLAFSFTEHNPEINRLTELINNQIYEVIINYKPEQEEVSKYNFYFLEEEYKQREHFKLIENSIEQLLV
jgi:hypothetical protein